MNSSANNPKLLVDGTLGKLARWLRLLGYDTAYLSEEGSIDILRLARAEGRVVLTRNHDLARQRGFTAIILNTQKLESQIDAVISAAGLPPVDRARCPVCNTPLKPLAAEAAQERVPPYIWRTNDNFSECDACRRVYWQGSHWKAIKARLQSIEA